MAKEGEADGKEKYRKKIELEEETYTERKLDEEIKTRKRSSGGKRREVSKVFEGKGRQVLL